METESGEDMEEETQPTPRPMNRKERRVNKGKHNRNRWAIRNLKK